jgi:hypothetical protein
MSVETCQLCHLLSKLMTLSETGKTPVLSGLNHHFIFASTVIYNQRFGVVILYFVVRV